MQKIPFTDLMEGLKEQVLRWASRNDSQNNIKLISEAATGDINTKSIISLCLESKNQRVGSRRHRRPNYPSILRKLEVRHWNTDAERAHISPSLLEAENRQKRQENGLCLPPTVYILAQVHLFVRIYFTYRAIIVKSHWKCSF